MQGQWNLVPKKTLLRVEKVLCKYMRYAGSHPELCIILPFFLFSQNFIHKYLAAKKSWRDQTDSQSTVSL